MSVQTIYARSGTRLAPAFPPPFPYLSVSGVQTFVAVDSNGRPITAKSGSTLQLLIYLADMIGRKSIVSPPSLSLIEGSGIDQITSMRIIGKPSVGNGSVIRQTLADLISGGQYVATVMARVTGGYTVTCAIPFPALGGEGNYLLSDTVPPYILTDNYGNPITVG